MGHGQSAAHADSLLSTTSFSVLPVQARPRRRELRHAPKTSPFFVAPDAKKVHYEAQVEFFLIYFSPGQKGTVRVGSGMEEGGGG